jgi:hypothetical protein
MTRLKLLLKHSSILLLYFLIDFWLINFTNLRLIEKLTLNFSIDKNEPSSSINFYNLFLGIGIVIIQFRAIKEYFKFFSESKLLHCTIFGTLVFSLMEIIYQAIAQIAIYNGSFEVKMLFYIKGVLFTSFLGGIISFLISYKIIANKKWLLLIFFLIFLKAFELLTKYFPSILEQNF